MSQSRNTHVCERREEKKTYISESKQRYNMHTKYFCMRKLHRKLLHTLLCGWKLPVLSAHIESKKGINILFYFTLCTSANLIVCVCGYWILENVCVDLKQAKNWQKKTVESESGEMRWVSSRWYKLFNIYDKYFILLYCNMEK